MLVAGGDSFTWGNELPDCDQSRFSRLSWSALLAERTGMRYGCVAEGGASNQTIARKLIKAVDDNTKFVVVMWTFPVRHEMLLRKDHANRLDREFVNISPWNVIKEPDDLLRNYAERLMYLAAHEYHERQSLYAMYSLYSYLNSKKVKMLFSAATTQVYDILDKPDPLCEQLRTANWYRYGEGFFDWAKEQGYEMSELNHPVAQAHIDWLDKYSTKD